MEKTFFYHIDSTRRDIKHCEYDYCHNSLGKVVSRIDDEDPREFCDEHCAQQAWLDQHQ